MFDVVGTLEYAVPLLIAGLVLVAFFASGLYLIRDTENGVQTRRMMGRKMPQGQVIAREPDQVGVLPDVLTPGLYFRMPFIWKVERFPLVTIADNKIGIVTAIDGTPLATGRVVADAIECNQFQNASAFLKNGGQKGPQIGILRPGKYRINQRLFSVEVQDATLVKTGMIGIVKAQDGRPLPSNLIVAPPSTGDHNFFQDGQAFLNGSGFRGPQLDTLQPGLYYVNPVLFSVWTDKTYEVPPGAVAVLRSNVGEELSRPTGVPATPGKPGTTLTDSEIHDPAETLLPLTSSKGVRGIYKEPLAPGTYNLNTVAYTAYQVPTNAIMIDWAEVPPNQKVQDGTFQFGALGVTSKDGFAIAVEVRLVVRISSENAAFIIARFGSVKSLIDQIIHPVIDAEFRNNAGSKKALEFVQSRVDLQKEALDKAKDAFAKYNVEAQNLLISQIKMPADLMDTQTKKEIALQQQTQYQQQAAAEQQRIAVQEMAARASLQQQVVTAELQVQINENNAKALVKQSEGIRDSTAIKAAGDKAAMIAQGEGQGLAAAAVGDGQASASKAVGLAGAAVIEAQGKAQAEAYRTQTEALGSGNVSMINVVKALGEGKIQIVPDVVVSGGDSQGGGNQSMLLSAWIAQQVAQASRRKQ